MPNLYIANPRNQHRKLFYRTEMVPGKPPRHQDIPAGQQALIWQRDMPLTTFEDIVRQFRHLNICHASEVKKLPRGQIVPLIFNMDAPVPLAAILAVQNHNNLVKTEDGAVNRKRAAIAAKSFVDTGAKESGATPGEFEVGMRTLEDDTGQSNIDEAIQVKTDDPRRPPTGTLSLKGRRKAA